MWGSSCTSTAEDRGKKATPRGESCRPAGSEAPASMPRPLTSMSRAWPVSVIHPLAVNGAGGSAGAGGNDVPPHSLSLPYAFCRRNPDEREDHATAIPGESGILPMPRGPPFSALSRYRGDKSDSLAQRLQFASTHDVAIKEADPVQDPPSGCGPLRLQQSVDHHADRGQVAGGLIRRREQFADAGFVNPPHRTTARPKLARYSAHGRFQSSGFAKPDCGPAVAAVRVAFVGQRPQIAFARAWVRVPPRRASGGGH